jgi:hypothetical protein
MHLKRSHDAKPERAVDGGVEAVEINRRLFHWRGNPAIAGEG